MAFFSPSRPGHFADPYPQLARLRKEEPVHWSAELGAWVLTRYEDCLRTLTDDEHFSSDPGHAGGEFGERVRSSRAAVPLGMATILGNSDAPEHTRLRAIVNRAFTPRVITAMRPAVQGTVDTLLAAAPDAEPFEVMSRIAEPLAVSVILQHLGVPQEGWDRVRGWSIAIMRGRAEGAGDPRVVALAEEARGEMLDYLAAVAEQIEDSGGEGPLNVLGALFGAAEEDAISPDDLLMMLIHISLAGNGPTAMALGNLVWVLGQHRESLAQLVDDPELVPSAVEELLRFESSTHLVVRFALQDTKVGARTIRAGQEIHVMVAAANRDPERFADPDSLDLARQDNRHLSFGFGTHFCLGAPLARIELEIALRAFLERFGAYELGTWARGGTYQVRGLRTLEISPNR